MSSLHPTEMNGRMAKVQPAKLKIENWFQGWIQFPIFQTIENWISYYFFHSQYHGNWTEPKVHWPWWQQVDLQTWIFWDSNSQKTDWNCRVTRTEWAHGNDSYIPNLSARDIRLRKPRRVVKHFHQASELTDISKEAQVNTLNLLHGWPSWWHSALV